MNDSYDVSNMFDSHRCLQYDGDIKFGLGYQESMPHQKPGLQAAATAFLKPKKAAKAKGKGKKAKEKKTTG